MGYEGLNFIKDGEFRVAWRGLDQTGQKAPSGLYVARLEFGGEVRLESMTLVR